jgi:MFS transporter, putative metabolite:H+ symporter
VATDPPALSAAHLTARLEAAPISRWHLAPRLVMGGATFLDAFDTLAIAFVLPVLVPLWQLSPADVGWLIAAGFIGQFAGSVLFGALAERYGRVRSAAAATALMSAVSLACAGADSFIALTVLRFVQGIGVGGEMPVAAVYVSELSRADSRGRFLLLYQLVVPVGLFVTGQVGALVVPAFGWPMMFLIGGVPGLVVAAMMLRLPESPRWLIANGRLSEAHAVIAAIEASAGHRHEPPAAQDHPPTRRSGDGVIATRWTELLRPQYRLRTLVVWTLWASAGFFVNGMGNWMPVLYNSIYGLSLEQSLRAGTLNTMLGIVVLGACAVSIDRVGRRRWAGSAFALGAAALFVLGFFAADSVGAVLVLSTAGYAIVGSINSVLYLYTPEIYPTRVRAIGAGSAASWIRVASAASQLFVGYLLTAAGVGAVYLAFALAAVVGLVAATFMLETSNRRLEDIAA